MKQLFILFITIVMLASCTSNEKTTTQSKSQKTTTKNTNTMIENKAINYLGTDTKISINDKEYIFAWSANAQKGYYKQEYIPQGQTLKTFTNLVTIDFLEGDVTTKNAIAQKIKELKSAKADKTRYAFVNYEALEKNKNNENEFMLDFTMGAYSSDKKKVEFVERNVYRYVNIENENTKGLLLFGITERAYGDNAFLYMKALKKKRIILLNAINELQLPKITLKK